MKVYIPAKNGITLVVTATGWGVVPTYMDVSKNRGKPPKMDGFIMENRIRIWMIWGRPLFLETLPRLVDPSDIFVPTTQKASPPTRVTVFHRKVSPSVTTFDLASKRHPLMRHD